MSSYHQHTIPSLTAKPDSSVTPPSELPQPPVNTRLPLGSIYPDGNTMSLNTPHRSTTMPSAANKSTGPPPRPLDQPRLPDPTTSSYNMTPSQSYHSTHHYPHPSQTLPPISHYSRQLSENHSIRLPPLSSVSSRADLGVKGPPLHPPYTPSPAYPPARKHVPQSAVDHHLPEMSTPTSSTPSSSSRMKKTPASSVLVTPSVFDSPTLARMQEDEIPIVIIPKVHSGGSLNLGGIQVPADFPGNYPEEYNRRGPVPELKKGKRSSKVEDDEAEDGDPSDLKKTNRQSQSSRNPWDYVVEDKHEKQRRRFQNSELQVLEILWSISQSPNKYQRQRLGGWLGVPTKHITVWFQNRRQDTKRFSKEKSNPPSSSSRANRGTYDPITGKWRPVPLSCISSVEPPPKVKLRAVNAIAVGDVTREDYFTWFPSSNGNNGGSGSIAQGANPTITSAKHLRPTVGRTVSSSLDDILSAREAPFARPRASRRGNSDFCLSGEGEERNQNMLALMSSSPPSSGAIREMRPAGDDVFEDDETDVEADDRSTTGSSSVNARSQASIGLGHPVARPPRRDLATLGRATSLDLVAASTRARHLIHPQPPRAVSGQSGVKAPVKMFRAVPTHSSNDEEYHRTTKRPKITPMSNVVANYRGQDSFQRSTSQSAMDVSYEEERGHVSSTPSPSSLTTPINTSPEDGSVRRVSSSFSGGLQYKPHGQTVYSSAVATHVRRTSGGNETDKEVLDAAAQLLSIFGGAQTA